MNSISLDLVKSFILAKIADLAIAISKGSKSIYASPHKVLPVWMTVILVNSMIVTVKDYCLTPWDPRLEEMNFKWRVDQIYICLWIHQVSDLNLYQVQGNVSVVLNQCQSVWLNLSVSKKVSELVNQRYLKEKVWEKEKKKVAVFGTYFVALWADNDFTHFYFLISIYLKRNVNEKQNLFWWKLIIFISSWIHITARKYCIK